MANNYDITQFIIDPQQPLGSTYFRIDGELNYYKLEVGSLWLDTTNNLLKRCTSISPITFTSVEGGSTPHDILSSTHSDSLAAAAVQGDPIVANSTPKWARLAKGTDGDFLKMVSGAPAWAASSVAAHNLLSTSHSDTTAGTVVRGDIIAGIGATPKWERLALGAANTYLRSNGTDAAWSTIDISTANVTGTLTIAKGGTGATTAVAAFNALSPVTTRGDIIIRGVTNNDRLAIGAAGRHLRSDGTDPSWALVTLTTDVTGTLPLANGGTGQTAASDVVGTANEVTVTGGVGKVIGGGNVTLDLPDALKIVTSILDTNGNEFILFNATASAVNQIDITNQATAANPKLSVSGGDTNISLLLDAKGTGVIRGQQALLTDPVTLTDAANIATDASLSNHFRVTLAGNRTLDAPTNPTDGQRAVWEFKQDATGSRTITLASAFAFGTDITGVTLTTTASKTDFMTAIYNSSAAKWHVVAFVKGY